MRRHSRRATYRMTLSLLAVLTAMLSGASIAAATTGRLLKPIVITPASGCGLLTPYTVGIGLAAWAGSAPPCGTGSFTLAFNQENTGPLTSPTQSNGVATAGSALL